MKLHFSQFSFLKKPLSLLLLGLFFGFLTLFFQYENILNQLNKPSDKEIHYLDSLVIQARNLSRLEPQKTLELGLVVLAKSQELNYRKGMADSYRLLSFSSWNNKNVVLTHEYLEKAKSIYQGLNHESGLADIEVSYGGITIDTGDTLGALEHYRKAYSIFTRLDQKDRIRVTAYNLAMVFTALNQLDSARYFLEESVSLKKSDEDIPGFGVIHTLRGKIAFKENKLDLAKTYFQESLDYFDSQLGRESFVVFFESSLFLGRILKAQGNIDLAIELLEKSIQKESIYYSEFFSRMIFLELIKLYELKEDPEKANRVFWSKESFEAELERRKLKQAETFSAELALYRGFQMENEELNSRISTINQFIILGAAITFLLLFLFLRLIYLNKKNAELRILLDKTFQIAEIGTFEVQVDANQRIRLVEISDTISGLMAINPLPSSSSVAFAIDQFLDARHLQKLNSLLLQFSGKEEFFREEFELTNLEGKRKVIRMIAKVIPVNKNLLTLKGILLDITEETEMVEKLRDNFEKEKNLKELREQLMHLTSHEIRTPLSNISSSVELITLLAPKILPEELQFRIKTIVQNARLNISKLVEMLDALLLYERLQSGEFELKLESIDMGPFLDTVISEVRESKNSEAIILLMVPDAGIRIQSDRTLLHHIFTNLLGNAMKYLDKNLPIEVEISENEKEIWVRIKDYGIGIPEKDISRLFTPFKRASNVAGRPGSGLGLSIIKRMVIRLGGEVAVNSKEGEFSEFLITLPKL